MIYQYGLIHPRQTLPNESYPITPHISRIGFYIDATIITDYNHGLIIFGIRQWTYIRGNTVVIY